MKRILVVDDEKDMRDLIKYRLMQHEYAVSTASGGDETLEVCRIQPPDLILLDIVMPRMDGYETCRRLKDDPRTKDIPVVFLTGQDLEPQGIDQRHKNLNSHGYICKPYSFEELLKKVKEVIG